MKNDDDDDYHHSSSSPDNDNYYNVPPVSSWRLGCPLGSRWLLGKEHMVLVLHVCLC